MEPNYVYNGMKSKEEAFQKIFQTLKEDEKTIVGKGTSDTLIISVGSAQLILKGHAKKGKTNHRVGESSKETEE